MTQILQILDKLTDVLMSKLVLVQSERDRTRPKIK